jgi:chromosome condensin MukBEF MukE localization factor
MTDAIALPHLREVFDLLRGGHHVSSADGPLWLALRDGLEDYQSLFEALGFRLEAHPRGFFYFQGREEVGKEARALAVFFFIIVEWLGDEGRDIESALFEKSISIATLPHLITDRYRRLMSEAGIERQEDMTGLLRRLVQLGFATRVSDDAVSFETPAWRFLDLCTAIAKEATQDPSAATPAGETQ